MVTPLSVTPLSFILFLLSHRVTQPASLERGERRDAHCHAGAARGRALLDVRVLREAARGEAVAGAVIAVDQEGDQPRLGRFRGDGDGVSSEGAQGVARWGHGADAGVERGPTRGTALLPSG